MAGSPFKSAVVRLDVHLLPSHLGNVQAGVDEKLNGMLLRYSESAGGVVVSYSDVSVASSKAAILYDSPYIHFAVKATFVIFAPTPGAHLIGSVTKVSPDHIGLLVSGLFNASIAATAVRSEFHYENDGWHSRKTGSIIEIGSDVRFDVLKLHVTNGIITVDGSLDAAATGVVRVPDPTLTPRHTKEARAIMTPATPDEPPRYAIDLHIKRGGINA